MARRRYFGLIALVGALVIGLRVPSRDVQALSDPNLTVSLQTQALGNTQWDYLSGSLRQTPTPLRRSFFVPTHPGRYCYWSTWALVSSSTYTGSRRYAIYIFDACRGNLQVFPGSQCLNDNGLHASDLPSDCRYVARGHIPIGLAANGQCGASAMASSALKLEVTPQRYDTAHGAALTAAASFADTASERLGEGTCTDVVDWRVTGWTVQWPDGTTDLATGSDHNGLSIGHVVQPGAATTGRAPGVKVVAHLHVHGTFQDFDAEGHLVTTGRDADLDISNHQDVAVDGTGPSYVLPKLAVGARPIYQSGAGADAGGGTGGGASGGDSASPDANDGLVGHLDVMRGRLTKIYPGVIVEDPGRESSGGVDLGNARTSMLGWTYAGSPTDVAGDTVRSGGPLVPLAVQWNHAERLNSAHFPTDETLPLQLAVHTVYPDGHSIDSSVDGIVTASIWYAAMSSSG